VTSFFNTFAHYIQRCVCILLVNYMHCIRNLMLTRTCCWHILHTRIDLFCLPI